MYRIGLAIIIISWIVCLNPYAVIFVGPVLLVGLAVVWFSKTSGRTKILTTVLPFLLWYPGFLAFMYFGSKRMTPETFLVPEKFRGQITLIYNESCGQTVPVVNGRLVYRITENGVMILKNEFETGLINQEYYFVNERWERIKRIEPLIQQDFNEDYTLEKNKNEPPRDKVGMFLLGTGGGSTVKNDNYVFHTMVVNSWDSLRVEDNTGLVDKLVDSLLFECRTKKNFR